MFLSGSYKLDSKLAYTKYMATRDYSLTETETRMQFVYVRKYISFIIMVYSCEF